MATLNWPGFGITSISPTLDQPSQSNANQWTGTRTVISDPWHGKWSFKVSLATVQGDAAFQAARAFFTSLKGQINTFHLPAVEAPQNANTGVTLSANAAQGATSIALTGLTTALVAGNMVTLNGQLLSLTSVGSLSGTAQTVNFMPTLRAAATSTTAVQTAKPYALVFLSDSSFSWDIGQWRRYGLTFDCQEAVAETDGASPTGDTWNATFSGSPGSSGPSVLGVAVQEDGGPSHQVTLINFQGLAMVVSGSTATVAATSVTETLRFGRASDPVAGDGPLSPLTFIYHDPLTVTGTITQIKAFGGVTYAGTMTVRRFTKSGTVFTQIGSDASPVSLALGVLNTFTVSIPVNAGEYLGFWLDAVGAGPLAYSSTTSDDGGFYYEVGNLTSVDTGTASFSNTLRIEAAFDIEHTVIATDDTASVLTTLQTSVGTVLGDAAPDKCEIALGGWTCRPMYGESVSTGQEAQTAISLTQPYSNVMFTGGVKSTSGADIASAVPLVEDNKGEDAATVSNYGETPISSAANHAVRLAARNRGVQPSQFVIFGLTSGHGGSKIADISKGTTYYTKLLSKITFAKALAPGAFVVPAIDLLVGINDAFSGTAYATALAQLLQLQSDLEADIQAITGQTSPVHFLVSQQSQYNSTGTGTTTALAAACRASRRLHLVTPQYLFERSNGDGLLTHFKPVSEVRQGHYHGRAFDALIEGRPVPALWPVSATADGTALEIRFHVPVGPIVLDASAIGAATDSGIKVVDGTGTLTLSSIAVSADGKGITATLNRSLGTSPKCRIGLDYGVSGTFAAASGTASNIRDSSPDTHVTSGTTYAMYHWSVADEINIVKLAEAA